MKILSNLTLTTKLYVMVTVLFLGMFVMEYASLFGTYDQLLEARKAKIQEEVQSAHSLVTYYHKLAPTIGEKAAKEQAIAVLRDLRFGEKGYVWVNDMDHRVVMHPFKPNMEGRDMSSAKDSTGKYHWQEMVSTVKNQGSGFVEYIYAGPQFDEPQEKISFVDGFKPWGWVIGGGVYISDLHKKFWDVASKSLFVTGIVLLVGLLGVLIIRRSITSSLERVMTMVSRVSDGDLSVRSSWDTDDEIGRLAKATNNMAENLTGLVGNIKEASSRLDSESKELIKNNEITNKSIESQFHDINSVSQAMDKMNTVVTGVSNHAMQASQAADEATKRVSLGHKNVRKSMDSMKMLSESVTQANSAMQHLANQANEIDQVVEVINNISEQTNLLALNAAIEAARAGEQGRGFAVVADEVRTLAMRTQESTGQIQEMIQKLQDHTKTVVDGIEESQKQAGSNVEIVESTGEDLQAILEHVERIHAMSLQIAQASDEQSSQAKDISNNLEHIHDNAEKGLEVAEKISQSSHHLGDANTILCDEVGRFRVAN